MLRSTEYLPAEQMARIADGRAQPAAAICFDARTALSEARHAALTTKDQIRERPADFIADTFSRRALVPWHTSGTTGKPLTILL